MKYVYLKSNTLYPGCKELLVPNFLAPIDENGESGIVLYRVIVSCDGRCEFTLKAGDNGITTIFITDYCPNQCIHLGMPINLRNNLVSIEAHNIDRRPFEANVTLLFSNEREEFEQRFNESLESKLDRV